jgi:hypothetical protein
MDPTAERFVHELSDHQSDEELRKIQRYFKSGAGQYGQSDVFLGVRMGDVFKLAKRYIDMPPAEIERLLESRLHEVRAGGCSIMAKQAARKGTPESRRADLYALYLRRHDRIDNWDLVDLAAKDVVGGYLADKPRDARRHLRDRRAPAGRRRGPDPQGRRRLAARGRQGGQAATAGFP